MFILNQITAITLFVIISVSFLSAAQLTEANSLFYKKSFELITIGTHKNTKNSKTIITNNIHLAFKKNTPYYQTSGHILKQPSTRKTISLMLSQMKEERLNP